MKQQTRAKCESKRYSKIVDENSPPSFLSRMRARKEGTGVSTKSGLQDASGVEGIEASLGSKIVKKVAQ